MIGEASIDGVFISWALVWALVAYAVGAVLRRVLTAAGFYRFVWHPALFDLAAFVILWGAVSELSGWLGGPGALLGAR
jgi:protein-S-isoprenylcysteine O-methyltransferase Ste14